MSAMDTVVIIIGNDDSCCDEANSNAGKLTASVLMATTAKNAPTIANKDWTGLRKTALMPSFMALKTLYL